MMTRLLLGLSLGVAGLMTTGPAAHAQSGPACGARAAVIETLAQQYGETRRGIGIAANNTVMEIFASADTGSWTIAVTLPDGQTCLMASGQGYEAIAEDLPARGDPA